ncbi:MAG: CARDB domain-containing protein [Thermoplasmata archaeon]
MGQKIRALSILVILLLSILCSFGFLGGIGEEADDSDMQEVALYLHGDLENATLNTSYGIYEEQQVLTTSPEDTLYTSIFLGEWETIPIVYPMDIRGNVRFGVYALGNLQQVRFTASLTVNGVGVSGLMTTLRQNLNESFPVEFISDPLNLTQSLELNTTDTIGLRLSLDHNDPRYYQINPPPGIGKDVTLVFGYGFGSFVEFPTVSMRVADIKGRDDPATANMIVTATIICSFGYEDFNYATAKSDYGKFTKLSETVIDNAIIEVEWEWDYTVTEGGSYPVKVTARDQNYNSWKLERDVHITTPNTEIDFSLSGSDISFSNDLQRGKNTTITAKIIGSGRRWSSYQVEIEFYDGSDLLGMVKESISRGGTNEVTLVWEPDTSGAHKITVVIDPDDRFDETNENNNEATKNVDVKEGSGDGTPGFDTLFLIIAISIALFFGKRSRRAK